MRQEDRVARAAALRAAAVTPESTLEQRWKAEALDAATAMREALDAAPLPEYRSLEELKPYAPPDAYREAILARREKEK